jgi:hypothetical protein
VLYPPGLEKGEITDPRYEEMFRRAEDIYRETMSGNASYMIKKKLQEGPLFEDKSKAANLLQKTSN